MTDITTEIPDFLAKHGITRLEDNLEPGQRVQPDMKRFWTLFGDDVMALAQDKSTPWRSNNDDKTL